MTLEVSKLDWHIRKLRRAGLSIPPNLYAEYNKLQRAYRASRRHALRLKNM